jgi:mannose-6-phosphate isomerase-like protein (cupin superfamily)
MTLQAALTARIPPPQAYGTIITSTSHLATARDLCGGTGTAHWMELFHGMHLPAPGWKCVEFVALDPGGSCGLHLHAAAEEIYFILRGVAVMTVNGEDVKVTAGDLVTAPIGTVHGIAVSAGAPAPMSFLVAEVWPGQGPHQGYRHIALPGLMEDAAGFRGYTGDDLPVAQAHLGAHLTGPWRQVSLIELPPGDEGRLQYHVPPAVSEVLLVAAGQAAITVGDDPVKGSFGLAIGAALGEQLTVANASDDEPLQVLSVELWAR